ncbi:hypothetical protein CHELA40_10757 [Chelatococcus asaccharovorans]|nr:hypothetical protein CHELA40_10757 [Chelatococcus asaccharovorans]CAH1686121.1 hypothetical protein CHELA17_64848 [Chelatococcus asaccharovorans]
MLAQAYLRSSGLFIHDIRSHQALNTERRTTLFPNAQYFGGRFLARLRTQKAKILRPLGGRNIRASGVTGKTVLRGVLLRP